jgi:hypothetical protein
MICENAMRRRILWMVVASSQFQPAQGGKYHNIIGCFDFAQERLFIFSFLLESRYAPPLTKGTLCYVKVHVVHRKVWVIARL